ncbi:MAG: hypothetical protein V3T22_06485 [Planctomycetota bacterium]
MTCSSFHVLPLAVLPFAALLLVACVTETTDDLIPSRPLSRSAVVSVGGTTPVPTPADYSWVRSSSVLIDDPRLDPVRLRALVRGALQECLATHGLTPGSRGTAMLEVGYVVALERELDESTVSSMFGLDAGLSATAEEAARYGKGTLIVNISSTGARTPLWRGSVQAFADLDLPDEVRRQRVRRAVELLLARVPFE